MKKRSYSLKVRIAFALIALVAIQGIILVFIIMFTGAIEKNDLAAYDILANQSSNRKNELQAMFNNRRQNIKNTAEDLSAGIDAILAKGNIKPDNIIDGGRLEDILEFSLLELVSFTKFNPVTGVFIVLDSPVTLTDMKKTYRTSMYLRNSHPGIVNGELLLEYGRVDIARQENIAVNYLWAKDMMFADDYSRDFYFNPINAALANGELELEAHGYWSAPFVLKKDDVPIITYSLPLILEDGSIIGVIGIELETNYLSGLMPASEVPYDRGSYLLNVDKGEGLNNRNIISSGAYAKQFLSGMEARILSSFVHESSEGSVYELYNENFPDIPALGANSYIELYEKYSPFYNERWTLICMAPKTSVLSGSNSVKQAIIMSIIGSIVIALVLSIFVILFIFNPIRQLADRVRSIDPEHPVRFPETGIREMDELSGAFEVLSDGVSEAAAKMFTIVELVNMPLGSFEIRHDDGIARLSKSLFKLLGIDYEGSGSIPVSQWDSLLATFDKEYSQQTDGVSEKLYVSGGKGSKRWLKERSIIESGRNIGVLIDITDEMVQKQRLEFERNYDALTKLYNRNAYMNKVFETVTQNKDKTGLMIFADLDDLKFVNDLHGHEIGDNYIKAFADFLGKLREIGGIVGRISGDEFVAFITGYSSRETARKAFDEIFVGADNLFIPTPDGASHKLRVSVGLSYYPSDSYDIKELVKFADYAMYETKHTIKGKVREFNMNTYNKNAFVLNMKNLLDLFINEKRVRFAFQPIVDARTGEIFAYEAYMRSMLRELKSPQDILRVARSYSMLYQTEKLLFEVAFESFENMPLGDKPLFINTVPNLMFSADDMRDMKTRYGHLFGRVIFDVTGNEFVDVEDTKKKMDAFRELGARVSVDDYGAGFSDEAGLVKIGPNYLKIDMSIIRDIDNSEDKQQIVHNIVSYAAKYGILIVAEGIENRREMETVLGMGVDYLQGYYLGRPGFDVLTEISDEIRDIILKST